MWPHGVWMHVTGTPNVIRVLATRPRLLGLTIETALNNIIFTDNSKHDQTQWDSYSQPGTTAAVWDQQLSSALSDHMWYYGNTSSIITDTNSRIISDFSQEWREFKYNKEDPTPLPDLPGNEGKIVGKSSILTKCICIMWCFWPKHCNNMHNLHLLLSAKTTIWILKM